MATPIKVILAIKIVMTKLYNKFGKVNRIRIMIMKSMVIVIAMTT